MVHYTDKEFKDTERVLAGKKELSPRFKELADWIENEFKVEVINLYVDYLSHLERKRLQIITRTERDAWKFKEQEELVGNFDSIKQEKVAQKYLEIVRRKPITSNWLKVFGKKDEYPASKQLFVCSSAFNPIAREATLAKIKEDEVEQFKSKINLPDLWTIQTLLGGVQLFLFTEKQVAKMKNSDTFINLKSKFFEIVRKYDKYNLFDVDNFYIHLDSKENFDENYESNWFYYYK